MIISAKDIAQQLASRADAYARLLLPNGKLSAGNWCVGSINGEKGESLRVQLTGPKAGVWSDFAAGDKGDLLNLTSAVKAIKLGEAIKFAKDWLGVRDPENIVPQKSYTRPQPKDARAFQGKSAVRNYLISERRMDGITLSTFRISESTGPHGAEIVLPSYDYGSDEMLNLKYIALVRSDKGKKFVRQAGGCAPALFGWQAVNSDAREIIITEGEIDAMTWYQIGFPAVSVPWGAGNDDWIDFEWEHLEQFDRIYLHYDDDKDGQTNVIKVARRLGMFRCFIIRIPDYKDANEALMRDAPEEAFQSAIRNAKPLSPQQIKRPTDFLEKVMERFYPIDGKKPGFFSRLLEGKLGMRPGEVTLWTGVAGHGKSTVLNQIMLEAVMDDYRCALASMEMPGAQNIEKLICQSLLESQPQRNQIEEILSWLSGKLWVYDLLGNVAPKLLLELMEYSYARHGVTLFIIDSLTKCAIDAEDYNAQRVFLNDLCSFAQDTGVHVNLVAHPRKGRDEIETPGKLDVKGSVDLINQPANVLAVWRNKAKEEKAFERNGSRGGFSPDAGDPDTIVYCHKQRENGEEFRVRLRFLKPFFRYAGLTDQPQDINIWTKMYPAQIPLVEEQLPVNYNYENEVQNQPDL